MPDTQLAVLRLHQRSATIDARERLTEIVAARAHRAAVGLLTCHRVEVYAAVPANADARATIAERLASDDAVLADAAVETGAAAATHLFRVSCGLDSAIVGEGQIANQVRRTYDAALERGLDPILSAAFQRALHLARTIRATTPLGSVRRSIGSLAVDEALAHVAEAHAVTALVIGAGEVGKLASRALARRVGRLIVANRDAARGAEVAAMAGAEAVALDALTGALARSDVVISAADTRGTLLTRDLLAARTADRPLVLVDIAVPRSVSEDTRALRGLLYLDVDDLGTAAAAIPEDVVADAERRCAAGGAAFASWLEERRAADTIRALRERAHAIRDRQLSRALGHLGHLSERDREVVASLATALTGALLHEPTVRLRRAPEAERAARALFGIEPR